MGSRVEERVSSRLEAAGVRVTGAQLGLLLGYFGLLAKWNSRVNLTGFTFADDLVPAIDQLLVEPLVAAECFAKYLRSSNMSVPALIIDLGSGGGSPAIPLHVAFPSARLVMVETKSRKAAFLREVARQVGLAGSEVKQVRIEELLAESTLNGAAGLVSVRAVKMTSRQWKIVSSLLAPTGRVLWFRTESGVADDSTLPLVTDATCVTGARHETAILKRLS